MNLREYLYDRGITQKEFAQKIEASHKYINHLIDGRAKPSKRFSLRIKEATEGLVEMEPSQKKYNQYVGIHKESTAA